MKKRDNQKMNMYAAVLQTCKDQQAAWQNIPGFSAAVDELENQLIVLHQTHVQQINVTIGVSANKNQLKEEMIQHLFVIAKALRLKGLITKNKGLDMRNRIILSELRKLSVNALLHRIDALQTDLQIHAAFLTDYGITAEFVTETQELIAETSIALLQPRMAIIARKGFTQGISEYMQSIDHLIGEQLDTLILVFKNSFPVFYNSYQNARLIIDYRAYQQAGGHGSKSPVEPDDGDDV